MTRRLFWVTVVVAVVPIVVAAVLAIRRGYVPMGDNAFFAIRARDVFSRHRPLLGTWTSASLAARTQFNNPGPLLFDVLAPTTRLFDSGSGLVLGVALLNCSSVLGIGLVARRCAGPAVGAAALAVAAALGWAMGSAVLFDPTQPSSLILPFLCFATLAWAVSCGDLVALPWAAVVGSLVLQSYVAYGYLVVALGLAAAVGLALHLWGERSHADSWPARRRQAWQLGALTAVVGLLCWLQPLIQQFSSHGDGNLTLLARGIRDPGLHPVGFGLGTRLVAQVVTLPPFWFRPSFKTFLAPGGADPPRLTIAAVSLAALALVLAACAWDAWRRSDRVSRQAIVTAAVLLAAGLITAGRMPIGAFGGPTSHTMRWLWPLAAFAFLAIIATLVRRPRHGSSVTPVLLAAFTLATVGLAAANLAPSDQGASADESGFPVVRDLGRQLARFVQRGTLVVDQRGASFGDPYATAVFAQLQRRSIPFVTDDPGVLYQLGPTRRFNGHNARARLLIREGDNARVRPPRARRVAMHRGLTAPQGRELARLEETIAAHLRRHGLRLNRAGRTAVRRGQAIAPPEPQPGHPLDAGPLFQSRLLVDLAERKLLVLDPTWTRRLARYAKLQRQADQQTVALFVVPL